MINDKGIKEDWLRIINEIEDKISDLNELNSLIRRLMSDSGLCVIYGSKAYNELDYNHERDRICEECGFAHDDSLCIFGRRFGDFIFKDYLNNKITRI